RSCPRRPMTDMSFSFFLCSRGPSPARTRSAAPLRGASLRRATSTRVPRWDPGTSLGPQALSPLAVEAAGHQTQRSQARHEEVVTTARFHELRQLSADEWRARDRIGGIALDHRLVCPVVIADERIGIVALEEVVAVRHPLPLHELELPLDARVDRHEDDGMFTGVV